jgi:hypothetical protein
MKSYLLLRCIYAFLKQRMRRLFMRLLKTRVKKKRLLLRMLSLRKHILTNLKCVSEMLSVIFLKRNVTRLKIETIDYTSRSLSILAAQTSRFLFTFLFFFNATNADLHKLYAINAKRHELQDRQFILLKKDIEESFAKTSSLNYDVRA